MPPLEMNQLSNEKELLLRIAEGDEGAFTILFNHYYNRIGAFVMALTGNRQYAQEIVQDVFIKIWLKRTSLPAIEQFNAYLYTVSRNAAISFLRSVGREIAHKKNWEQTVPVSADEQSHDDSYYRDLLQQAISHLPDQQRKVYLLSREEGLKQAEIAEKLSLSLETVKKHMVLALRFIREYLARYVEAIIVLILTSPFNF